MSIDVSPDAAVELPESVLPPMPRHAMATALRATIRRPAGQSISVRPHVQAFADACSQATGADSYGTYLGHSPTADRALDIFVPVSSRTLGDAICDFALEHLDRFGVDYVIYRQHIYNPEVAPYWRQMADRGDNTQNHVDHVHISFEASAAVEPEPAPSPEPTEGVDGMEFLYGITTGRLKGQVWLFSGSARIHTYVGPPVANDALKAAGVAYAGDYDEELHKYLSGLATNAGFTG